MIDNVHALSMGRVTNEGGVSVRDGAGTNNTKILLKRQRNMRQKPRIFEHVFEIILFKIDT